MPELAEVEFYRRQWHEGAAGVVVRIHVNEGQRVLRSVAVGELRERLTGARMIDSEARGKQLLFKFSKGNWLGVHLGMTGELLVEAASFEPTRHDHLVLFTKSRALVFRDPRKFGRNLFYHGTEPPGWWSGLAPAIDSPEFTGRCVAEFLQRHGKLPVKATLLLQEKFPGLGNWMADEILWRSRINPRTPSNQIVTGKGRLLWKNIRDVAREAIHWISPALGEPPAEWLFHQRWSRRGQCPIHKELLQRDTIGGRTTVWCARCQPALSSRV